MIGEPLGRLCSGPRHRPGSQNRLRAQTGGGWLLTWSELPAAGSDLLLEAEADVCAYAGPPGSRGRALVNQSTSSGPYEPNTTTNGRSTPADRSKKNQCSNPHDEPDRADKEVNHPNYPPPGDPDHIAASTQLHQTRDAIHHHALQPTVGPEIAKSSESDHRGQLPPMRNTTTAPSLSRDGHHGMSQLVERRPDRVVLVTIRATINPLVPDRMLITMTRHWINPAGAPKSESTSSVMIACGVLDRWLTEFASSGDSSQA